MFTLKKYLNKNTLLKLTVYALVIGLFWLKMSYIQSNIFSLNVENPNEANILAFNPLSSIFLIFGIGVLLAGRRGMLVSYILGSLLLYVNILFYREYNDFITIPMLNQVANLAGMGGQYSNVRRAR